MAAASTRAVRHCAADSARANHRQPGRTAAVALRGRVRQLPAFFFAAFFFFAALFAAAFFAAAFFFAAAVVATAVVAADVITQVARPASPGVGAGAAAGRDGYGYGDGEEYGYVSTAG